MTDSNTPEDEGLLDIADLDHYIVMGVRKGTLEPVVLASPNLTVPDMGALLGRAMVDLQMQCTQAAMHRYTTRMAKEFKGGPPSIQIVPGMSGMKKS